METQPNVKSILGKVKREMESPAVMIREMTEQQVEKFKELLDKAALAHQQRDYIKEKEYLEAFQLCVEKDNKMTIQEISEIYIGDLKIDEARDHFDNFALNESHNVTHIKKILSSLGFIHQTIRARMSIRNINGNNEKSLALSVTAQNNNDNIIRLVYNTKYDKVHIIFNYVDENGHWALYSKRPDNIIPEVYPRSGDDQISLEDLDRLIFPEIKEKLIKFLDKNKD